MLLLVTATESEAASLPALFAQQKDFHILVAGVGPVETALRLTRFLSGHQGHISMVLNFGVAGAYLDGGAGMLDVCLAGCEAMGDFGIASGERIAGFGKHIPVQTVFPLENSHLMRARQILAAGGIQCLVGNFVTVNATSGTASRGNILRDAHQAICENMEGAAAARVCQEFGLPLLEVRCVSNMVEDRNPATWQLAEAMKRCALAVELLVGEGIA